MVHHHYNKTYWLQLVWHWNRKLLQPSEFLILRLKHVKWVFLRLFLWSDVTGEGKEREGIKETETNSYCLHIFAASWPPSSWGAVMHSGTEKRSRSDLRLFPRSSSTNCEVESENKWTGGKVSTGRVKGATRPVVQPGLTSPPGSPPLPLCCNWRLFSEWRAHTHTQTGCNWKQLKEDRFWSGGPGSRWDTTALMLIDFFEREKVCSLCRRCRVVQSFHRVWTELEGHCVSASGVWLCARRLESARHDGKSVLL